MKNKNRQFVKQGGSALILVVVVTVLLAVVGVMFMMVSRASEMESSATIQSKDLDSAVDTVVERIDEVLVEDLFGNDNQLVNAESQLSAAGGYVSGVVYADESSDYPTQNPILTPGPDGIWGTPDDVLVNPGADAISRTWDDPIDLKGTATTNDDIWLPGQMDDYWLASLEPTWRDNNNTPGDPTDDNYVWPHITDLWGTLQGRSDSLYYQRYTNTNHVYYPQMSSLLWIDPDDTSDRTTWDQQVEWDIWQVSAENLVAKVIQPKDRMDVVAVINGTVPSSWQNAANETAVNSYGARADADGDGVADSRWVQVPSLTTSRGEPVFAAVRIIDNCGMLNLNGAHCFYQEPYDTPVGSLLFKDASNKPVSPFEKPWFINQEKFDSSPTGDDFVTDYNAASNFADAKQHLYHKNDETGSGRYPTEINYLPFLRGSDLGASGWFAGDGDNWYGLMLVRGMYDTVATLPFNPSVCDLYFEQVDNLFGGFHFFDISDELELRNRYLLTSYTESQVEQKDVLNFTLDSGGGVYAALRVPREDKIDSDGLPNFYKWKFRLDADNFDTWDINGNYITPAAGTLDLRYRYDRRHVCTTYSFDRNLRKGQYPLLDSEITNYINTNGVPPAFATQAEYKDYLWGLWEPIFTAKGSITTNIENLYEVQPYNNLETRKRILHLLYALREYYLPSIYETMDLSNLTVAQQAQLDIDRRDAAIKAAQVVANLIDFSDIDSDNTNSVGETQGPFYNGVITVGVNNPINITGYALNYGAQANTECTFITRDIVEQLLIEVSQAILGSGNEIALTPTPGQYSDLEFGLEPNPKTTSTANDIAFGYERQPFISEVYANYSDNGTSDPADDVLVEFAIELVNPYSHTIDLTNWILKIGTSVNHTFTTTTPPLPSLLRPNPTTVIPAASGTALGRLIILFNDTPSIIIPGGAFYYNIQGVNLAALLSEIASGTANIDLLRSAPTIPAAWNFTMTDLLADHVANADIQGVVAATFPGLNSLKRSDTDWEFIFDRYDAQNAALGTFVNTLGADNGGGTPPVPIVTNPAISAGQQFQLAMVDNQSPICRWHELETLSLFGYDDAAATSPQSIPQQIETEILKTTPELHYDLAGGSNGVLDYITTINRPGDIALNNYPDLSSLPGRININTAPVYVIAAAIPPSLADPAVADPGATATSSALQLAKQIVAGRPYSALSDLLTNVTAFKQYDTGGAFAATNVGDQNIDDDTEERDWILSNLANKFTVRSDVFTAYILVRLGTDGPQRRMIGIFDRSQVWEPTDRPKLVALHPVPDPR